LLVQKNRILVENFDLMSFVTSRNCEAYLTKDLSIFVYDSIANTHFDSDLDEMPSMLRINVETS